MKMQKINRPLNLVCSRTKWPLGHFPIDLLLLSIDICQEVTCKNFKINTLKIEKNKNNNYQSRMVKKGVFPHLSIGKWPRGHFYTGEQNGKGFFEEYHPPAPFKGGSWRKR